MATGGPDPPEPDAPPAHDHGAGSPAKGRPDAQSGGSRSRPTQASPGYRLLDCSRRTPRRSSPAKDAHMAGVPGASPVPALTASSTRAPRLTLAGPPTRSAPRPAAGRRLRPESPPETAPAGVRPAGGRSGPSFRASVARTVGPAIHNPRMTGHRRIALVNQATTTMAEPTTRSRRFHVSPARSRGVISRSSHRLAPIVHLLQYLSQAIIRTSVPSGR